MIRVAFHTARQNTALEPHLLYDGQENDLTAWLRRRGVKVLPCRTYLYDELSALARRKGDLGYLAVGAGAFLRMEIPELALHIGIDDHYVLYTDCDVMFLGDVGALGDLRPRYFAVAPEHRQRDYFRMNTKRDGDEPAGAEGAGRSVQAVCSGPSGAVRRSGLGPVCLPGLLHVALLKDSSRDFRLLRATSWLRRTRWDRLPPEYNWKPYWGDYGHARLVHFHGPKPQQRETLRSPDPPPHLAGIKSMVPGSYDELCDVWYRRLEECDDEPRPA